MGAFNQFVLENLRGNIAAGDFARWGANLGGTSIFSTIALESYEGYVAGGFNGLLNSVPGMFGAVLGGVAAGALIAGMGLTGGLAVLGAAGLGGLLGWVGEKIGDRISENWSGFAGVQQITDAWDTLSQRIGDFVESFTISLNELWDNPTEWLDDLLNLFNPRPIDPLVIDLDGDGIELTALNRSSAFFDLDGDGFRERTGWVSPDDGLLALDRNGNGRIEGINELFGSATTSGYEVLRALDSNRDGRITAQDAQFSSLRIWRDLRFQPAEGGADVPWSPRAGYPVPAVHRRRLTNAAARRRVRARTHHTPPATPAPRRFASPPLPKDERAHPVSHEINGLTVCAHVHGRPQPGRSIGNTSLTAA